MADTFEVESIREFGCGSHDFVGEFASFEEAKKAAENAVYGPQNHQAAHVAQDGVIKWNVWGGYNDWPDEAPQG